MLEVKTAWLIRYALCAEAIASLFGWNWDSISNECSWLGSGTFVWVAPSPSPSSNAPSLASSWVRLRASRHIDGAHRRRPMVDRLPSRIIQDPIQARQPHAVRVDGVQLPLARRESDRGRRVQPYGGHRWRHGRRWHHVLALQLPRAVSEWRESSFPLVCGSVSFLPPRFGVAR